MKKMIVCNWYYKRTIQSTKSPLQLQPRGWRRSVMQKAMAKIRRLVCDIISPSTKLVYGSEKGMAVSLRFRESRGT